MCYDSPASHTVHVNLRVFLHVSSLRYTCGEALDLFNSIKPVRPISPRTVLKKKFPLTFH